MIMFSESARVDTTGHATVVFLPSDWNTLVCYIRKCCKHPTHANVASPNVCDHGGLALNFVNYSATS